MQHFFICFGKHCVHIVHVTIYITFLHYRVRMYMLGKGVLKAVCHCAV